MVSDVSRFDVGGFHAALDSTRIALRKTWRQVAREAGVSASTLTRMSQGKRPDVDSLAALCRWASIDACTYMPPRRGTRDPLVIISACIRSDDRLTPEAAIALDEMVRSVYQRLRAGGVGS